MYVKRPLILKKTNVTPGQEGLKKSIDAFLDLLITSGKDSFKADEDFGFSLEDYRFEIYSPETGSFHHLQNKKKKDLIESIEDPSYNFKITGSSINSSTFAEHLRDTVVQYERRLKNVEVGLEFLARGTVLLVSVTGIIDNGYETPYNFYRKIQIW